MINNKKSASSFSMLLVATLLLNNMADVWAQSANKSASDIKLESLIVNPVLLLSDPLTSSKKVLGEADKRVTGGEFTAQGWKSTSNKNYMMIALEGGDGFDGALEIDLIDLDWKKANTSHNQNKIKFLSMFSNPSGCPHVIHGGSNMDALWMLSSGRNPDNTTFFGEGFRMYWSALGASQAEPSMYAEEVPIPFERKEWAGWKKGTNTIRIYWSKEKYLFGMNINGIKIFEKPFEDQMKPFKYIFIGATPEFHALVGPTFSNLKVYGTRPGKEHTVPVPEVFMSVPASGSTFDMGSSIPMMITPRVEGKAFQRVEFFVGTEKVGEDSTFPFSHSWQPGKAGFYQLKVMATDKSGKVFESPVKHIIVNSQTQ